MTFNIARIIESKKNFRVQLASRPVAEKLRLLEDLRNRAVIISNSRAKLTHATKALVPRNSV